MTASRDIDDISTAPGGKSGAEWTTGVRESVLALWALNGGMLQDVAGTNTITASVAVGGGFNAYGDGLEVGWIASASNTGAATLNLGTGDPVSYVGAKALRDNDGDVLAAGAIIAGRYAKAVFRAEDDHWRLVAAGGTTNVTVQGGILLQRSAPSRLLTATTATTSVTALGSLTFQAQYADSVVVVEGNASLVTQTGTESATGILIALYVDGVSVDSFTAHVLPSMAINIPLYFSYSPGDISSHIYSVRVSSSISAIYPKGANMIFATEFSPNT